ncbi:glycosyltransferase family 2 protein [Desulfosediminicola sp.]|uniref:glycosyltransferase family 2 protein n=1 Tax=Desulfosediminicola sp. TaxID=2886825 RepID=UPI003AF288A4
MSEPITAIVVTYNRKDLLVRCLEALLHQSIPLHCILIVDNCSTDGTYKALIHQGFIDLDIIRYVRLPQNIGGAGGFHEGVKILSYEQPGWLWLLDDDAVADQFALEHLVQQAEDTLAIYGSVAVDEIPPHQTLCWPTEIQNRDKNSNTILLHNQLPSIISVKNIPFLGFFIHTSLVREIGLPDRSFFISGDDAEYCARARQQERELFLVKESIIGHPLPVRTCINILGRKIYSLSLPPWKRYYDVRNRILIAKKHYGNRLWLETIPGTFVRWLATFVKGEDRLLQSKAFMLGIFDGIFDRKGCRWLPGKKRYG